ncbi:hypothetical protein RSOLAG1IB_08523 [Rhizoctonia solani AG-1 IB]|uniref:Uncharacterized protein n=1 Tax=Thanatephorus cucumeris (strain AG1-IB / isolate 7/3/14) TaxID=1108050 RepID=A0A0B7FK88_THACB|nr:hypothetical protein RSOLAG1IB_08523 [Rhizoctonia solani AG-1 IB]
MSFTIDVHALIDLKAYLRQIKSGFLKKARVRNGAPQAVSNDRCAGLVDSSTAPPQTRKPRPRSRPFIYTLNQITTE